MRTCDVVATAEADGQPAVWVWFRELWDAPDQFRVDGIPALLIFKNGQLVDKLVGLQPKPAIAARLAAHA